MAAAAAAAAEKKCDDEKAVYIHTATWRKGVGSGFEWYKVDLEQNQICRVLEGLLWPAAFLRYYTAVALDSVIYLLGVVASPSQLSWTMLDNNYDAVVYTDGAEWRFAPHMKCSRRAPRVVALHGKIYAFGGNKRNFAEVFDPNKGCWDFLPGPPTDYVYTHVLSDSSKGRILVCFASENTVNCLYEYDLKYSLYAYYLGDESWKCLNPHFGHWYQQCVLVDDMLYFHTRDHRFLIAYDLVTNEWLTAVWSDSDLSIPIKWDVLLHLGSNKFCVASYRPLISEKVEMAVYFFQFLIHKDLAGNLLITPGTWHSFIIEGGTNVDNYLVL